MLIGLTAVGTVIYGINKIFKKYALMDIVTFVVITVLIFGAIRLTIYALSKGDKDG